MGALPISAAVQDSEVLDTDLRAFAAEQLDAGAGAGPTEAGDFLGLEVAFRAAGRSWGQWYLRSGRQLLLAT